MKTRHQDPENRTFRQDAFASSAEYDRGVLGNLVAARCQLLDDANVISILWWLQQISWREGGLTGFARDFLLSHTHLFGTKNMHRFGRKPGQVYTADQVRAVRSELRWEGRMAAVDFLLRGESSLSAILAAEARSQLGEGTDDDQRRHLAANADRNPVEYPAEALIECCQVEPEAFADQLKQLLVDPATSPVAGLWNMPGLFPALVEIRTREAEQAASGIVETDVTRKVADALDFAHQQRAFVIIEGREGIGKTEAAVNWCARHPGQAVYIKLPSGDDEMTFFRAISKAIGTAYSRGFKPVQMRARIEDALQAGHLTVVVDESHFLWPQSFRTQRASPKRVDWLRTAIIDSGVPVALVCTPQHFENQCERFRKAGWNSNQIQRRVTHTLSLPENLGKADILLVTQKYFPDVDRVTLKRIAGVALGTIGYLGTIRDLRKRVDFFLSQGGAATNADCIARALAEKGLSLPSADAGLGVPETAVKAALKGPIDRTGPAPRGTTPEPFARSANAQLLSI
jgi:hypothetical protein